MTGALIIDYIAASLSKQLKSWLDKTEFDSVCDWWLQTKKGFRYGYLPFIVLNILCIQAFEFESVMTWSLWRRASVASKHKPKKASF